MSVLTLSAAEIVALHEERTVAWHEVEAVEGTTSPEHSVLTLIERQHRANFDLWHEEDKARDPEATGAAMVEIKHRIDRLNQTRNDLVERIDALLLSELAQNAEAPLHSETPGLIVDRMSILALKIFHTRLEVQREGGGASHRSRNVLRLGQLEEQREDLAGCLDALWAAIQGGARRFKLYRQLKMYNDPELNPVLYGRTGD